MINVFIADDHAIVRQGLKQVLADTIDIIVVGEASNGKEVLNKIWKNNFDILLLDISMPGISGLDVIKKIRSKRSQLPILILSMYPEDQYAIRALSAGASGYLAKTSAPDELTTAIRKIWSGEKYISSSLAKRLASNLKNDYEKSLHEKLSDREYQVMCMIATGKSVKNIAEELSLSVNTISTHRAHILKKMNMKNNAEITFYGLSHRLTGE